VGPIAQWFNAALAHHHAGRIAEAERVCRQILVIDPDHAQNLHVLGLTEGVVYRCRRFEYPLVGADTNSTILQDYRPHHLAQCSHCEIVERPGSHWTHRWREPDSNHRSRLQKGPSTGLEFVNRGDPSASVSVADTGFASGKAENMIA
jgi:hypothetical protein